MKTNNSHKRASKARQTARAARRANVMTHGYQSTNTVLTARDRANIDLLCDMYDRATGDRYSDRHMRVHHTPAKIGLGD